jgi:hypothetical protein
MSLDLYLNCGHCGSEVASFNYTYNVAKMWYAVTDDEQMVQIEGMAAYEAAPKIQKAIEKLKADPETFRKMNPPNGWGDYDRFVEWLEEIRQACLKNPDEIWRASR